MRMLMRTYLALSLLSVAGELVGGPVDVVLDGVDGGLDEAPGCRCQLEELWSEVRGHGGEVLTRPVRWCCQTW